MLDILTQSHLLSEGMRHKLKIKLAVYLRDEIGNEQITADNRFYDELLYYTKQAKGEDQAVMNVIYERLAKTLSNRDTLNNLFATRIYSHEWLVVTVLFGITLFFATQTDFGHSFLFGVMLAILCTGLTLLMVIIIKFGTLTHKEAKRMWQPLHDLVKNHFDDVKPSEIEAERERILARA